MRPVQITVGSLAANTSLFATAQLTVANTSMSVTGTALTYAGGITLTSTGVITGLTFTINGTDADGHLQQELLVGPNNNTVTGVKFFKTVTSLTATAVSAATVSAGNSTLTASPTFIPDYINSVASMGYGFVGTATATYKLQHTYDDVFDGTSAGSSAKTWFDHATVTGKTLAFNYSMTNAVRGSRIALTAWTTGTVTGTLVQGLEK